MAANVGHIIILGTTLYNLRYCTDRTTASWYEPYIMGVFCRELNYAHEWENKRSYFGIPEYHCRSYQEAQIVFKRITKNIVR